MAEVRKGYGRLRWVTIGYRGLQRVAGGYNVMVMNKVLFGLLVLVVVSCKRDPDSVSLAGSWMFRIDSLDQGLSGSWFAAPFDEYIVLPGSMAQNGKGRPVDAETQWTGQVVDQSWYTDDRYAPYRKPGNIKIPFWLQSELHYVGPAWYQRVVTVPTSWKEKRVLLNLERCHWETTVWVDSKMAGNNNSLATPHLYDLTALLSPGQHLLTIRVDNRMIVDVGVNAHSVSDHTQSNWNGIVGDIELIAGSPIYVSRIRIDPNIHLGSVKVTGILHNTLKDTVPASLTVAAREFRGMDQKPGKQQGQTMRFIKMAAPGSEYFEMVMSMGDDFNRWDEFSPDLYQLELDLEVSRTGDRDFQRHIFGMREFIANGTRFSVNGRQTFLRGTLECAIFPETGYPAMDVDEWSRIYAVLKSHGLNHMRFHSWCPPRAAFIAADLAGIYLQVECGAWTTVGNGTEFDTWIYTESNRIVEEYGNHPSFCMMAYGNEPGGANQVAFLDEFVRHWKERDDRRVYTAAAGWPNVPSMDFFNPWQPRIQAWGEGLNSIINALPPQSDYDWTGRIAANFAGKPVVSHEIGQWCVYPDLKEIDRYTGVLEARNFEIFKETLEKNHMGHLADSFLLASGKLQTLCYKADIEAALRTEGMAGFQLLDLHDFPGQGTALVGVLNAFWEEKGYVSPEEFSRFCNYTVPLARIQKMVLNSTDTLKAFIEIAHFGADDLEDAACRVLLSTADSAVLYDEQFSSIRVLTGSLTEVHRLEFPLSNIKIATSMTLSVTVGDHENSWDLWAYPATELSSPVVPVFSEFSEELASLLESGGSAILSLGRDRVAPEMGGNIALGFSSIFWNTAWTRRQAPHTLGILCDPGHPALKGFPTEYHSNWQWWDIISSAKPLLIDGLDSGIQPLVRVIDDWFTNRRLALLFECRVGNGKLVVSGADLVSDLAGRPASRQLLQSLTDYMQSGSFDPAFSLTPGAVSDFIRPSL